MRSLQVLEGTKQGIDWFGHVILYPTAILGLKVNQFAFFKLNLQAFAPFPGCFLRSATYHTRERRARQGVSAVNCPHSSSLNI